MPTWEAVNDGNSVNCGRKGRLGVGVGRIEIQIHTTWLPTIHKPVHFICCCKVC